MNNHPSPIQAATIWKIALHAFFLAIGAAVVPLLMPRPVAADEEVHFRADYTGTFTLTFGTGPDGTNNLDFSGTGKARHLGKSAVEGHTTTAQDPTNPLCSDIVTDMVVLTAANGYQLWLVNSGEDCLDLSVPGKTFIRGSETFVVVGGTGRFDDATGNGIFSVVAEVTGSITGGVSGTFELHFEGDISPPADD
jgi:hypothetical protein